MVHYKFVLAGDTGTGKTAQFRTMPGRKFAQVFDPAASSTLDVGDCAVEEWFPKAGELSIVPRRDTKTAKGHLYERWAIDFNKKLEKGFFENVDSYMLDSVTLLGQAALDQELARKPADERIAYRLAGETLVQALWAICALPCHVVLTMHTKFATNETTSKLEHRLTIPGGSKLFLPRLVSALWFTSTVEAEGDNVTPIRPNVYTGPRFLLTTRPLPRWPHVRTPHAFAHLPLYHDVTIENWAEPWKYGLGQLLAKPAD